jgi:hypothetical protein
LKYKYNGAKVQVQTIWYKTLFTTVVEKSVSAEATFLIQRMSTLCSSHLHGLSVNRQHAKSCNEIIKNISQLFIAIKIQCKVSDFKDNQWFFEYYQNDTLISEKIAVKF